MTGPGVTAAMKAEDVPGELVEAGIRAWYYGWAERNCVVDWPVFEDTPPHSQDERRQVVRTILAAVLPEIQAQALRDAAKDAQASGLPFRFSQAEFLEGRAARLTATTEEPTT